MGATAADFITKQLFSIVVSGMFDHRDRRTHTEAIFQNPLKSCIRFDMSDYMPVERFRVYAGYKASIEIAAISIPDRDTL